MTKETTEKILVVVDPTREDHLAVGRAVITSRLRDPRPEIHVFIGVDSESTDTKASNKNLYRDNIWFENLMKPLEDEELQYSVQACWSTQWQESILESAEEVGADMIVIPDYSLDTRQKLLSDANWALLRKSPCPVLIVRPGAHAQRKKILAAINVQDEDPRYVALNEKVLSRGKWAAEHYGAEFHVVNAYPDSLHYPDRGNLVRQVGLDSQYIHVKQGSPEDAISEMAKELNADIVLIGTMAREGVLGAMRGNTSEKVLGTLSQDVMTVN